MSTLYSSGTLNLSRCPHCCVANPLLSTVQSHVTSSSSGREFKWKFYACSRCGMMIIGGCRKNESEISMIFPESEKIQEGLPDKASTFLSQAIESVHAPSGAIMLCASAVDSMLKEKGLKKGSLYSRIEEAASSGLITSEMSAWAHEIRLDANDERHADEGAPLPSSDDAKKCIDFVRALADFMFVLPARVARGRQGSSS